MRAPFNRRVMRNLAKADQCLMRRTRIPGRIRETLRILAPGVLERLADRHGCEITASGYARLKPAAPTNDSTAAATSSRDGDGADLVAQAA